jgi:hypothetical protein
MALMLAFLVIPSYYQLGPITFRIIPAPQTAGLCSPARIHVMIGAQQVFVIDCKISHLQNPRSTAPLQLLIIQKSESGIF